MSSLSTVSIPTDQLGGIEGSCAPEPSLGTLDSVDDRPRIGPSKLPASGGGEQCAPAGGAPACLLIELSDELVGK
jgi:hypothetical protein